MTKWYTATEVNQMIAEAKREGRSKFRKATQEIAVLRHKNKDLEKGQERLTEELEQGSYAFSNRTVIIRTNRLIVHGVS